jgi:hypothetical protein
MTELLDTLRQKNEPIFYFGWLCLAAAALCLVLTRSTDTQVLGINAWWKPFKFFLSTVIFLWSMAFYLSHLPTESASAVRWWSWGMIVIFVIENGWITWQAARGETSHFNVSTPPAAAMWSMMAVAATMISVCTAAIGWLFFKNDFPALPPAYLLGIRLGLILFVVFSLQGLMMGARMAHTIGAADGGTGLPVVNWSRAHGDLRVAHFLGMHALQVLPLLGYFVLKNVRAVAVFGLIYGVFVVWTLTQALAGKPLRL